MSVEIKDYGTIPKVKRQKVVLSQFVACSALFLLLIDLGMSISFVTVVVPTLLQAKEGLSMNEEQASWFGSVVFLFQPLGSIFSGPILDYFGRKKSMFLVNVPHVIAWLLMYFTEDLTVLFIANVLLGVGTGVMEAPSVTYLGEVSDNQIRGSLTSLSQMFTCVGVFSSYLLGTVLPWRYAALVCLAVPIGCMLLTFLIPESPIWLISQEKHEEAIKSLCNLRGWCKPSEVEKEYKELLNYHDLVKQCSVCSEVKECPHKKMNRCQGFIYKVKYLLFAKETLRPLILIMVYFTTTGLSGLGPLRPNMINICRSFGMALDANTIVVIVGILAIVVNLFSSVFIKFFGKRPLVLGSMIGILFSCLALSVYAKLNLNDGVSSYRPETFPTETSTLATILFLIMAICSSPALPWVLLSEVFPFRSRGLAAGLAAAGNYAINFVSTKTHLNIENSLHIHGVFLVYAGFALVGFLYLYIYLPETEKKSLIEIEEHFSGNDQIVDSYIKRCYLRHFAKKRSQDNVIVISVISEDKV